MRRHRNLYGRVLRSRGNGWLHCRGDFAGGPGARGFFVLRCAGAALIYRLICGSWLEGCRTCRRCRGRQRMIVVNPRDTARTAGNHQPHKRRQDRVPLTVEVIRRAGTRGRVRQLNRGFIQPGQFGEQRIRVKLQCECILPDEIPSENQAGLMREIIRFDGLQKSRRNSGVAGDVDYCQTLPDTLLPQLRADIERSQSAASCLYGIPLSRPSCCDANGYPHHIWQALYFAFCTSIRFMPQERKKSTEICDA